MSKTRKAAKYTAAGGITVLYAATAYSVLTGMEIKPATPGKVAIVAGILTALTWTAALA